jgi:hypothetical protein
VRVAVVAAALILVAAVSGATAQTGAAIRLLAYGPAVISPNRNGVNDAVRLVVQADPGAKLELRAYVWGKRLHGWRRLRLGPKASVEAGHDGAAAVAWGASNAAGIRLHDGSYVVTVCHRDAGRSLAPVIPRSEQRPGAAEESVSRPPWRLAGCLGTPKVVRVERLAAYVDATTSFEPGADPPLVVSADHGRASVELQDECSGRRLSGARLPLALAAGLYHYTVSDPAGDTFEAPVVVRNSGFSLERPPTRTALVVWPYLTWRAYNGYDANLDGRSDSWYQFWRQRRVSLVGPLIPRGLEGDRETAGPFSRWLCSRSVRAQQITDVELGRLPLSTLRRYRAVVFPGHTEYYEPRTYDLLKRYRDGGGNLVFLQANPFYRQVRLDRAQNAVVMTDYDAREGRSDFALAGVGYDGCCFPKSRAAPYVAAAGRDYQRVRWLFRGTGIGPGEAFGVASSESDRIDPELTPRDHVIAGLAVIHGKRGVINAAMVWSRAGRGQVFATGNYTFLRMRRALTFKLLDNVWRRLVE